VAAVQQLVQGTPAVRHRRGDGVVARKIADQLGWRDQRRETSNAQIIGMGRHDSSPSSAPRNPAAQKSRQGRWRLFRMLLLTKLQLDRDPSSASGIGNR